MSVRLTLSRSTVLYKEIRALAPLIMETNLLAIDPSCGSTNSVPGWAHFRNGFLVDSGVMDIDIGAPLHIRLQQVMRATHKLASTTNATILAYENVPAVRFHGRGRYTAGSQASLLKAVGVVMAASMTDHAIGLRPSVWKKLVSATYVKSDRNDAVEMGLIVCQYARHIMREHPPRVRGSGSKSPNTKEV